MFLTIELEDYAEALWDYFTGVIWMNSRESWKCQEGYENMLNCSCPENF